MWGQSSEIVRGKSCQRTGGEKERETTEALHLSLPGALYAHQFLIIRQDNVLNSSPLPLGTTHIVKQQVAISHKTIKLT